MSKYENDVKVLNVEMLENNIKLHLKNQKLTEMHKNNTDLHLKNKKLIEVLRDLFEAVDSDCKHVLYGKLLIARDQAEEVLEGNLCIEPESTTLN